MDWSSDTLDVYPLSANSPKAISVIIYIEDGVYGKADFKLSEKLWKTLDCDVRAFSNPTRQDLDIIFCDLRVEINTTPNKHSYLALTFIGHGGKLDGYEYIQLKNDTVCYKDELYEFLSTSNFSGLAGKPKLLFLQVCRGQKQEIPAAIYMSASTITRSQRSDLFILHPSFTDFKSYYDLVTGESPFIQAICSVFKSNFQNLDILKMATLVKNKISGQTFNGYTQTVESQGTLTKTFYFIGVRGDLPNFIQTLPAPNIQNSGSGSSSASTTNSNSGSDSKFKFKALALNFNSETSISNGNAGASTINSKSASCISNGNARASTSNHNAGVSASNRKAGISEVNRNAVVSTPNTMPVASISNGNAGAPTQNSNTPPDSSNINFGSLTSNRIAGESTSYCNTRTRKPKIECDTCGTISNTPRESRKPWSRGRLYYPCCNQRCEQFFKFIVWADGEELEIYLRAKEKKKKCFCSNLAKRSITTRGSNKGIPYYHCRLRDCRFWSWERDIAFS